MDGGVRSRGIMKSLYIYCLVVMVKVECCLSDQAHDIWRTWRNTFFTWFHFVNLESPNERKKEKDEEKNLTIAITASRSQGFAWNGFLLGTSNRRKVRTISHFIHTSSWSWNVRRFYCLQRPLENVNQTWSATPWPADVSEIRGTF